jgi:glutathione peroxidase
VDRHHQEAHVPTLSDFTATALTGERRDLSDYAGDVVLVVNTASRCGLTPQYAGLEQLWERYRDQGLTVLGFPTEPAALRPAIERALRS